MEDAIAILALIVGIFVAFALMALFNAISDRLEARWNRRKYVMGLTASFIVFTFLAVVALCLVGEGTWGNGVIRYVVLMLGFFAFFSLLEMVDHDKK